MRIDIVTIFPEYLTPLELSLAGRARSNGILDLRVHDLRRWTTDRHRTVDDAPYGGGAGMVMKPEPWGAAFDELIAVGERPAVIFTSPSGMPFTQGLARELATCPRLIFACGRYEGIDQRVVDQTASRAEVLEISIGDYVLNGGEVAALAITEAVVRLLPGFVGNPASLVEESHEDGLLEYPVYTRPPSWRGHDVPAVLLSGDHQAVEAWRRQESLRRTAERRPDLAHPAATLARDFQVRVAKRADAGELLALERASWVTDWVAAGGTGQPAGDTPGVAGAHVGDGSRRDPISGVLPAAVTESYDDVVHWSSKGVVFVAQGEDRILGAVRGRLDGTTWCIDRLMVSPDLQARGLGRALLSRIESVAPEPATAFEASVAEISERSIRLHQEAGYLLLGRRGAGRHAGRHTRQPAPGVVLLTKPR